MTNLEQGSHSNDASVSQIDMKLEAIVIPVSDVDRAKGFYERLGWRLDADLVSDQNSRLIQLTPPGSGCSIQFGRNLFGKDVVPAPPGSAQGLYLVVSDIEVARNQLVANGAKPGEVFHCVQGHACRFPGNDGRISGYAPERKSYRSFLSFRDPDSNSWLLQEVTTRLANHVTGGTTYTSAEDVSQALRRAAAAHGQHELRTGQADPNWADWYATYLVNEQTGEDLPQ